MYMNVCLCLYLCTWYLCGLWELNLEQNEKVILLNHLFSPSSLCLKLAYVYV